MAIKNGENPITKEEWKKLNKKSTPTGLKETQILIVVSTILLIILLVRLTNNITTTETTIENKTTERNLTQEQEMFDKACFYALTGINETTEQININYLDKEEMKAIITNYATYCTDGTMAMEAVITCKQTTKGMKCKAVPVIQRTYTTIVEDKTARNG